ncbi:MAG TPA: dihydropteroate synthase, partial [Candidatus Dormibacteraeota bacterium]|nr:dihydropteroate synthase [Candidatus Dormibacteraeota bacterium]
MIDAATAARYNVRPLLPGPQDVLRDSVLRLGLAADRLTALATHGAVEALAVQGLTPDLTRVLERLLRERGGTLLSDADGQRVLLLAPLMAMGQLPAALAEWSEGAESLGSAIGEVLMARGAAPPPLRAGDHLIDFHSRTVVMGILNVTPDSFAGDALPGDVDAVAQRARGFVAAGADLLDLGGESTRPNAQPVEAAEELARVLPALRAVRAAVDVPVSIDTRKSEVAAAAVAEGAALVNDIWGLRGDPAMAGVLAAHPDVALIAMHNQRGTQYGDLMEDICAGLRESLRIAQAHGVAAERIVVDPGFGFGKTPAQNLELMRRLRELRGLGRPVLLGPSRKSTIGAILGGLPPEERVEGTLALLALAVDAGVSMVRVHDVAAAVRAVRVADAVVRGTPEAVATLPRPG